MYTAANQTDLMSNKKLTMRGRHRGDAKGRSSNTASKWGDPCFSVILELLMKKPTEKQTVKHSSKYKSDLSCCSFCCLVRRRIVIPEMKRWFSVIIANRMFECNGAHWTFSASQKAAISRISSIINIPAIFSREEAGGTAAAPICRPCCYDRGGDVRQCATPPPPFPHHPIYLLPFICILTYAYCLIPCYSLT